MLRINPTTASVYDPPIALAKSWIAHREFPASRPLIDLSQAVPGYPPPEALREHMAEVARTPGAATYPPSVGLPHVREIVAAHLGAAYGATIDVDSVMITTGCNQAFCLAVGALAEPGDEWILPVPHYFNHDMWLQAQGVVPRYLPLGDDTGFLPDPDRIAALINERTRAVTLVTPNNPVGAIYPPGLIEACADVCRRAGIALVLDETYKDFRPTTAPPHGLFTRADWADTVVHLFSFSKVLSLAGFRIGSLSAHPAVIRQATKLADCMNVGTPRVSQEGVAYGLTHLGDWVEAQRVAMQQRVESFTSAMHASGSAFEVTSAGSFFAWVRHPHAEASHAAARALADDHNLLTIPGACFGPGLDRYLRVAFGNVAIETLPDVAARFEAASPR